MLLSYDGWFHICSFLNKTIFSPPMFQNAHYSDTEIIVWGPHTSVTVLANQPPIWLQAFSLGEHRRDQWQDLDWRREVRPHLQRGSCTGVGCAFAIEIC